MSAPTTINPSFYEEMLTYKKYSIESRIMDETTEDRVELGKLQVKSDANIKKMQVAMNNLMLKTQCLTLLRELGIETPNKDWSTEQIDKFWKETVPKYCNVSIEQD